MYSTAFYLKWQCSRIGQITYGRIRVRFVPETVGTCGKDFRIGLQFDVHFQSDDCFKFHLSHPLQLRFLFMKICRLFKRMSGTVNGRFVKMFSDDLQSDRKSSRKTARHGNGRNAGKVHRDDKDVIGVHFQRIIHFFPELKGRCRGCRTDDDIIFFKNPLKILLDQRPDFQRFFVIRIIIAELKTYVPNIIRLFTSVPKPSARVFLYKSINVLEFGER